MVPVIKASLSYQEQARENINRNGDNWCSGSVVYYFKYEATTVCPVNYLTFQLESNTSSETSSFLSFPGLSSCWMHMYDSADFFPHTDLYFLAHHCILSATQFDTQYVFSAAWCDLPWWRMRLSEWNEQRKGLCPVGGTPSLRSFLGLLGKPWLRFSFASVFLECGRELGQIWEREEEERREGNGVIIY